MKNLTIRRLALGVLMTFVLAFGVQDIAEAVAEPTFSQSETDIITLRRIGGTVSNVNTSPGNSILPTDPTRIERVTISKTGGIVFTGIHDGKSSVVFTEEDKADTSITGTAVPIRFTSAGRATIKVSGTAYTENVDDQNTPLGTYSGEAWSFTYIYYVTQRNTSQTQTVSLTASGLAGVGFRNGYTTNYFADGTLKIHSGSGNYPVTYTTTTQTNLKIHLRKADRDHLSTTTDDGIVDLAASPVSSAFDVYLDPSDSQTVTATVESALVNTKAAYINGFPTLALTGTITAAGTTNGHRDSPGASGQLIESAITATVNDGASPSGVSGVLVAFTVRDSSHAGGTLVFPATTGGSEVTDDGILVGPDNRVMLKADNSPITSGQGKTLYVQTENGTATVNFLLGSGREQEVTVTAIGKTEKVSAYTGAVGSGLELIRDEVSSRAGEYDVYVRVEEEGERVGAGYEVEFSTSQGELTATPTTGETAATTVRQRTDARGIAYVVYDPQGYSGNLRVTARIRDDADDTGTPDGAIVDDLVLNVRGSSGIPTTEPTPPTTTNPTLTLSSTTISGAAGSSQSVTATVQRGTSPAPGIAVTFQVGSLTAVTLSTNANGQASHTFTLPSADTTLSVSANVLGTVVSASAEIDVTGATDTTPETDTTQVQVPTEILIDGGDDQVGEPNRRLPEDLVVRVVDRDDNGVSGERVSFSVVEGRGRLSPARTFTDADGYADVGFTPQSMGMIEIEAATGDLSPVTFTITTGEPPDAIVLVSGNNQSGRPSERLANPFIVEVVDANDDPVSGVTVTFAATAGGGTLSTTTATTNGTGRAQTYLRLGDEVGENTVVARVTGLTAVTFTATSGAEVLVSAAQRPPLYWISRAEGKLHRLVDEEVENLAPNIDNILSLTVDTQNQLLYWTRQTAQSKSAIQRAGLNGRGVITLQTSLTLMTSIAVDSTGTTLYWADILGKIKSRPVQGNRVTLLAQNLSAPTGLVWANEYLYWGEATGQIRRMNLRNNRRTIETIATSSGEPVSLAVQSGRVYWTEISGNAAQLNRVNTNGTGLEALKTLVGSRRVWLDVDGSSSKLYLTRASKLERRGLSGRSTVTLVSGLASPGSLVLGGELVATPPVVSQPTQPAQPPDNSKYDVNGDGTVDLLDVIAPLVQPNNMKNDVNGDGVVDIRDTQEIDANRDATAAAPSLDIDVKALDLDFDRVQGQIETLLTSGDMSHSTQRALLYLQHLLASARPDETVLLANYPNPFNPETWIPYHLSESTDVRVNIYDAQGVLVRVLSLGHQTAGYYTSRSRAAYWDGLNALGERVASGIYFYQLQTDATSPMRKMVILK